jgi:hypothetical protein
MRRAWLPQRKALRGFDRVSSSADGVDSLHDPSCVFCLMLRACAKCGKPIPVSMGSRCAEHPSRWRSGSTTQWRKTRERILARDGTATAAQSMSDQAIAGPRLGYSKFTTPTTARVTFYSFPTRNSRPSAASTTRVAANQA